MIWVKRSIITVVVLGILGLGYAKWKNSAAAGQKTQYITAPAEYQTVVKSVSANGILTPFRTVDVKSKAGGRVVELRVEPGDVIKPGSLIARVDPVDMRANYDSAKAALDADTARARQAQYGVVFQQRTNTASLAQAQESLNTSRARLKQAEESLAYQKEMTTAQIQEAQQAVTTSRARLSQAEKQALAQPRLTETAISEAEASYQDARQALLQLKSATQPQERALAQASLDQAKANASNMESSHKRLKDLVAQGFASQRELDDMEAQRLSAKATLSSAQEKMKTLNSQQDAEMRASEARVRRAQATLDNVRANAVQVDLKQDDLTAARSAVKQSEASLATAQANSIQNRVRAQEVEASKAAVKQAEAALRSAQANAYQESIRGQEAVAAQAQIVRSSVQARNAQVNLNETTITAPSAGWPAGTEFIVTKKYIDQGTIIPSATSPVATGVSIVQIADRSRMFVDAQVDETEVSSVSAGQEVQVTLDAFPSLPYEGKVTRVDPQAEVVQNVTYIHVQVEILDPDPRLKPGMNANCEFINERKENVLAVPSEAVKEAEDGKFYVETYDAKKLDAEPERIFVNVGVEGMVYTEIKGGKLKPGTPVITATIEPITQMNPFGGRATGGTPRMPRNMR